MSIITISRGSYSRGKQVADTLAGELGYECVSREIILKVSHEFDIPETTLVRAVHDAPSILDRFTRGKERYVASIRAALLEFAQDDNLVYHGFAGHFFLRDVPGVLKVRIIADLEARIDEAMQRDGISADEARYTVKRDDEERRKWSLHLYGIDTWDSSLYDIVLNIGTMSVQDAVATILRALQFPAFRTTPETREVLAQMLAETKAAGI